MLNSIKSFLPLSLVPREGNNSADWGILSGKTCRSSEKVLRRGTHCYRAILLTQLHESHSHWSWPLFIASSSQKNIFHNTWQSIYSSQRGFRFPPEELGEDGSYILHKAQTSPRTRRCREAVHGEATWKRQPWKPSSDCLVLPDAVLWKAGPGKPAEYGERRYCFR